MSFREILFQKCNDLLQIELGESQLTSFETYLNLLMEWNEKISLTAIRKEDEILMKHFIDSLFCTKVIPLSNQKIADIGTGAGFPGIPLKILNPSIALTLVESVQKKSKFLSLVVQELSLSDVNIVSSRAEEIGHAEEFREQLDWVVARSVANLSTLVEYMLPLVKMGGKALALKGSNINDEIALASNALEIMGGKIIQKFDYELPEVPERRSLVVIEKVKSTEPKYPRRVGIPLKRPL